MKTLRPLLSVVLGLAAAGGLLARDVGKANSRVEVKYFEPENFTDVRDSAMSTDFDRNSLAELSDYLLWRAPFAVPPGQKLTVTFTDIDLAGDFEPWRGVRWSEVRIVKPLYPAHLKFSFALTDANGTVLKSGERDLTDMTFTRLGAASEALRFEKGLLDDWFRTEFPRR